jgi:hypothetical protein
LARRIARLRSILTATLGSNGGKRAIVGGADRGGPEESGQRQQQKEDLAHQ